MTSRLLQRTAGKLVAAIALTGLAARCDGTPLPEPPDNAPTPSFRAPVAALVDGQPPQVSPANGGPPDAVLVELSGRAGAVDPRVELWSIVLDAPAAPVLRSEPAPDGSFTFMAQNASVGDRIRLVSRGPTGHSPARDFQVIRDATGTAAIIPEPASPLACLTVSPADELSVRASATLTLRNDCPSALTLEASSLRLGAGFVLGAAPASIAPGTSASLTLANDAPLGPTERGDVLLLALRDAAGTRARYALGVYAPAE